LIYPLLLIAGICDEYNSVRRIDYSPEFHRQRTEIVKPKYRQIRQIARTLFCQASLKKLLCDSMIIQGNDVIS
jgi:hypothetical protein